MSDRICSVDGCGAPHYCKGLCKPCYRKAWYEAHRDHEQATMAAWRATNAEYDRQRWADYHAANRDRLCAVKLAKYHADREAAAARVAEYRAANRAAVRRRKAEARRNDPNWPIENRANAAQRRAGQKVDYTAILAEHGLTCHICREPIADRTDLHFDHVIPLSRGGAHSAENIRPAHARCNLRKGARVV
jgi:5-methylcytosine-specific restriction endonuclease McrA